MRSHSERFDVVVVGGGIAGMAVAMHLTVHGSRVALVTKGAIEGSTSRLAQGGIAVVSASDDSLQLHYDDTMRAGAGLCDEVATRLLVQEAPACVEDLMRWGARFDRDATGALALSKEGGHSVARVIHAGGVATGAEVMRALTAAIRASEVCVLEHHFVTDLALGNARCLGVHCLRDASADVLLEAGSVIVASGGAGQMFAVTTNPPASTGDGVAMALRAGVAVADVEFVQFHPTALAAAAFPRPLLSEALRGHGALLRSAEGDRFVDELAARDVVSLAIAQEMARAKSDHVFLDVTALGDFAARFPSISSVLAPLGIDPSVDWLPVAPAAHYLCGGVLSDLDGATALAGLFAIGEVACSGVQGANRLASNSLLEGLVFARRAAHAIEQGKLVAEPTGALAQAAPALEVRAVDLVREHHVARRSTLAQTPSVRDVETARAALQQAMGLGAGIARDRQGLVTLRSSLDEALSIARAGTGVDALELENLATVASALVAAALAREEARGAHFRTDFPQRDDDSFRVRLGVAEVSPRHEPMRAGAQ